MKKLIEMRCKVPQAVYDLMQRTKQLWSAEEIETAKNLAMEAISSSII